MRHTRTFQLLVLGVASIAFYRPLTGAPKEAPLTSEQLQVYGDFVESFSKTNFKFLSNKTFPLDLSSVGENAACLQGLQLEGADESPSSVHSLSPEVLRGSPDSTYRPKKEESAILKQRDTDAAARGGDPIKDTFRHGQGSRNPGLHPK